MPSEGAPEAIADPLDPALLGSYAILRRPGSAADQPPPINSLADQLSFTLGRYNPAFIRQLTQRPGGRRFFVVPGFPVHMRVPPARCLPRRLRPQRPKLVEQQRRRERQPIACIVTVSPHAASNSFSYGTDLSGSDSCPRFRDLTKYANLTAGLLDVSEHAGILPDGIAAVRVHFRHAPTVQVAVVQNFYLYRGDPALRKKLTRQLGRAFRRLSGSRPRNKAQRRRLQRRLFALELQVVLEVTPTSVELLAADGHVVADVKRPKNPGAFFGLPL